MGTIGSLLSALDEREVARQVRDHDEARMRYPLSSNTVRDFDEFRDIITDYYIYHDSACISRGGRLSRTDAYGEAKELLEREGRRRGNANIVSVWNDAHDGTNGGLRVVLDTIADSLKLRAVERYTEAMFDMHVAPNAWDDKVEIIRQFIGCCGPMLAGSIVAHQPERYAHDFTELIKAYVEGLRRTSSIFRRL
jgi:hypothetical protein